LLLVKRIPPFSFFLLQSATQGCEAIDCSFPPLQMRHRRPCATFSLLSCPPPFLSFAPQGRGAGAICRNGDKNYRLILFGRIFSLIAQSIDGIVRTSSFFLLSLPFFSVALRLASFSLGYGMVKKRSVFSSNSQSEFRPQAQGFFFPFFLFLP